MKTQTSVFWTPRAPEHKTGLSKVGLQGCMGLLQRQREGRWSTCLQVVGNGECLCCIRDEKRGLWILSKSPRRQRPNPTSVVWPELVVHITTWQCRDKQGDREVPSLVWSAVQGVLPLIGGFNLRHCEGAAEAYLALMLCGLIWHSQERPGSCQEWLCGSGWGPKIWRSLVVSLVPLVKVKGSGRNGWILQFYASANVCTAGVENRDLAFRTLWYSSKIKDWQEKIGCTWPSGATLPTGWPKWWGEL